VSATISTSGAACSRARVPRRSSTWSSTSITRTIVLLLRRGGVEFNLDDGSPAGRRSDAEPAAGALHAPVQTGQAQAPYRDQGVQVRGHREAGPIVGDAQLHGFRVAAQADPDEASTCVAQGVMERFLSRAVEEELGVG